MTQQFTHPDCQDISTVLECVEQVIYNISFTWFDRGLEIGGYLFLCLAVLEIIVGGYMAIRKQGSSTEILKALILKVLVLGLVLLLLVSSSVWLESTLLDFPRTTAAEMAGDVGGVQSLSLSNILSIGFTFFTQIVGIGAFNQNPFWLLVGSDIITIILCLLVGLVTFGAYIRLAIELLKTTIDAYLAVGGGALMIGFLAFRGTAPLGEGYLRYIVYVTIKLFFLILLIAFAVNTGEHVVQVLEGIGGLPNILWDAATGLPRIRGILSAGAFALVIHGLLSLPDKLAQQFTSSLSINIKRALEGL